MEIERKFLVRHLPENLEKYTAKEITQGYLSTEPVVRVRRDGEEYYLTYKGKGLVAREEANLPLTKVAFEQMLPNSQGIVIDKTRYLIPLLDGEYLPRKDETGDNIHSGTLAELDIFHGAYEGLLLVEVEFDSLEQANCFVAPEWFGEDVTEGAGYQNSRLALGEGAVKPKKSASENEVIKPQEITESKSAREIPPARNTTLCYVEQAGAYLMMLRNKKKVDENAGKWIGIGGKFEAGESPEECLLREAKEETGLELTHYSYRGIVTFVSDEWGTEYMHLFTADGFRTRGTEFVVHNSNMSIDELPVPDCDEGELRWIPKDEIMDLNLWEGDRDFLKLLLEDGPFFSMRLEYQGDELVSKNCRIYE